MIIAICAGNTVQSQDTLKLFGHQKTRNENTNKRISDGRKMSEIQTLTGPGHSVGFYVGFTANYSQIDGYDAFGAGATIAMIGNHGLAIGLSGKGFFTEPFRQPAGSDTRYGYAGGYGGLLIEPIIFPTYPVHVSFPILLGAGGIAKSRYAGFYDPYDYDEVFIEDADAFFVAEPGIEIEFNVTRWMRLAAGGTYRFTTTLSDPEFQSDVLNGFTGGISLKFGMF